MMTKTLMLSFFLFTSTGRAEDTGQNLPDGVGRDAMVGNCLACHSVSYVTKSRKSRDGWAKTIKTMQTKNGLWQIEIDTLTKILDYLELHFGNNSLASQVAGGYSLIRPQVNPLSTP